MLGQSGELDETSTQVHGSTCFNMSVPPTNYVTSLSAYITEVQRRYSGGCNLHIVDPTKIGLPKIFLPQNGWTALK